MTWQAWFTLVVAIGTIVSLARDLISPVTAMMGAAVALLIAGIVSPSEAFAGFGNPAPMTVAALYIIARAVEKTGLLNPMVYGLLGHGGDSRATLARLVIPAAAASAFLNNTPIVAMLIPVVLVWCDRHRASPSRYLMPLSFAVVLGGVTTAIGTSTNLVVSGLMEAQGMAPMGLFEITPIGLPVALLGVGLLVLTAKWLLPERTPVGDRLEEDFREFIVTMEVEPEGPLANKPVEAAGLRNLQGVFLIQIERSGELIAPVGPDTVLRANDRLAFVGRVDMIVDLQRMRGLTSTEQRQLTHFDTSRHSFSEAVIGATSPLVGRTVKEAEFRSRYQAAVVAIHRSGERINAKLGEVKLKVGDTLLLLADHGFSSRWRDRSDFLLVAPLGGTPPGVTKKAWLVGLITLAVVGIAGAGLLPILQAALLGVAVLVATGLLTAGEARNAVDLDVIIVIAASFAVGTAIEKSGLAAHLADGIVGVSGGAGPIAVLLGVILATVLLTELITNNAAAALMFPIAFAAAQQLGVDPRAFAIGIAVSASNSFLTPIGYQTNTMVYGPGGYRFGDYLRLGLPLTVAMIIVTAVTIAFRWNL
ncbi:MAG: SLC13 family permease [Gemmatimonadetes bacterium]|nr:SLC13 family permease [Gemmatimonadota bacterium]